MTTSASGRKITSACDGVSRTFNCPAFLNTGDLQVFLLDSATAANADGTLLSAAADYTVAGNSRAGAAKITTTATYGNGKFIRTWRQTSRAQTNNYVPNDGFPSAAQELAVDRLSLIDVEHDDDEGSAIRANAGDTITPLPPAAARASKFMQFLNTGTAVALITVAALAAQLAGPIAPLLAQVVKGDPGGNAMSIGPFTTAATHLGGAGFLIPVGTDTVDTSFYGIRGDKGGARYVYDPAVDNAYIVVNPRTSFMSTNNRGFRIDTSRGLLLTQTGGVADCTGPGAGTDNVAAFNAAQKTLGLSGVLRIPMGAYRFVSTIACTNGIVIEGEGHHENPGIVNGVVYVGIQAFPGSVLVFDADVPGIIAYDYTDNNADAAVFELQSARRIVIRDLLLYGGGGVGTAAHGVELRTTFELQNVSCRLFAGCGFKVNANTSGAGKAYGNASSSAFIHCRAQQNKLHGFHIYGIDANVIGLHTCSSASNGGAGFLDDSFLGINFVSCHAASNNLSCGAGTAWTAQAQADNAQLVDPNCGSYVMSSIVAASTLTGCYVEGGLGIKAHLLDAALVDGGNISSLSGTLTDTSTATILGVANKLRGVPAYTRIKTVTGLSQLIIEAGDASYTNLLMKNVTGTVLDVLAIGGTCYLSNDAFNFRKSDQTTYLATLDALGLNITAPTAQVLINGTKVLGARQPAIANDASGAGNQATVNAILAAMRAHGFIS